MMLNFQLTTGNLRYKISQIAYSHAATMFTNYLSFSSRYFGAPNVEEYNALKKNLAKSLDSEGNLTLLKALNRRLHRGPQESYAHEVVKRFPEILQFSSSFWIV